MRHLLAATVAIGLMVGSASAQTPTSDDALRLALGQQLVAGPVAKLRKLAEEIYRRADVDGRGVSEAGYELAARIAMAQMRSGGLVEFLRHDLDGDGKVSRAEALSSFGLQARRPLHSNGVAIDPTPAQVETVLAKLVGDLMAADADRNGTIDLAEMIAATNSKFSGRSSYRIGSDRPVPLTLDRDRDGVVSRHEFDEAVDNAIRAFDVNGDGEIDKDERDTAQRQVSVLRRVEAQRQAAEAKRARLGEMLKQCTAPSPPAGAKVVLIGGYEGASLSSVRIGASDSTVVLAAELEIMDGDQPLYVIATSYTPMVWKVSGKTGRVAAFVTTVKSGVTGLQKERVTLLAKDECLPYFDKPGENAAAVEPATLMLGGRSPEVVVGHYSLARLRLPLGQHVEARTAPDDGKMSGAAAALRREFHRFNPGGLAVIDPAAVVAAAPVETYQLLPQQAGLMQLLEAGLIEVASYSRSVEIGGTRIIGSGTIVGGDRPTKIEMVPDAVRIKGAMRFPAGLYGAHGVTFLLPPGVPMPQGDRGHSRVLCEATGKEAEAIPAGGKCP